MPMVSLNLSEEAYRIWLREKGLRMASAFASQAICVWNDLLAQEIKNNDEWISYVDVRNDDIVFDKKVVEE